MRSSLRASVSAVVGLLVLAGGLTAAVRSAEPTPTPVEPLDCGPAAVQQELANGAAWRMCATIHPVKGLVLEQVEFRPASGAREYDGFMRVLDEIYLAQLNVPYDTGLAQFDDITSYGFGNQYLLSQTAETCPGSTLDVEQAFVHESRLVSRSIPGMCVDVVPTGLSTHSSESQLGDGLRLTEQGSALEVSSLSKIAWYEYQEKLTFDDQGGVDVALGATGDLAPGEPGSDFFGTDRATGWPLGGARTHQGQETFAASHWHSATWRVDFGIGGSDPASPQFVERWEHHATDEGLPAPVTSATGVVVEQAFTAAASTADDLTWWRVGNANSLNPDGHARSYEIVNHNPVNGSVAVTRPVLTVTNDRACAEYASHNLDAGCPGDSVLDYVADDTAPLTDPVAWVNVGYHHVDRDEDQSPMHVHWQRFQLIPRDFFAQSPSVTPARSCLNGPPGEVIDSVRRPCVATNVARPTVRASTTPVAPGTILTATKGLWIENRTTWAYAFLWFRDGEPIVDSSVDGQPLPAVGPTYTVSPADVGHALTVKVTASQVGYQSGVAESRPLPVPGGPAVPPTASPSSGTTTSMPTAPSTLPPTRRRALLHVSAPRSVALGRIRSRQVRATIRVRAQGLVPTGEVHVTIGRRTVSTTLLEGRARIRLPRVTRPGRHRMRVLYGGSVLVAPTSVRFSVQVRGAGLGSAS